MGVVIGLVVMDMTLSDLDYIRWLSHTKLKKTLNMGKYPVAVLLTGAQVF